MNFLDKSLNGISKKCKRCDEVKSSSEFYTHSKAKDGFSCKCKVCVKLEVKLNRDSKSEYYRNYDKFRYQNDENVSLRHAMYRSTENGKAKCNEAKLNWISNNPDARKAHIKLGNAVKNGVIQKPSRCSVCDKCVNSRSLHAHHDDYSLPLEVVWLCAKCHKVKHQIMLAGGQAGYAVDCKST